MADSLRVLEPGLLATVQDFGRFGFRRYGVSTSGALDPHSLALANALCGNEAGEAGIEVTLNGAAFAVEAESITVAVAGGDFPWTLDGEAMPALRSVIARRGQQIRILPARSGMRAYLAIGGGLSLKPVLGSRSTHVRSLMGGLDGRALREGDALPLAAASARPDLMLPALPFPRKGPLRIVTGPQEDFFTAEALETLLSAAYTVAAASDRMACQLDGPVLAHRAGFNIISDGLLPGSIQVPGHGRPIILLADCQTTGGYPKIATVISADLPRLGQRRPGEPIAFELVSSEEAEAIAVGAAATRAALRRAIVPAPPRGAPNSAARIRSLSLTAGIRIRG